MEQLLEKTYSLAGDNNLYQRRTLIICLCFWILANVLPSSLSFFEEMPIVDIYNKTDNRIISQNQQLNYTICENNDIYYRIIKEPQYSVIAKFNIECDKILVASLGSAVFAGGSIGSMMLQFIINSIGRRFSYWITFIFFGISLICVILTINYIALFALFFFIQLFIIMLSYNSIINLIETCNPELRSTFVTIVNTGYSISGLLFTLVYYFDFTWKFVLILSTILMLFFTLVFYHLTVRSPRYYVSVGNYIDYYRSVRYIAKVNQRWSLVKKLLPIPKDYKDELLYTPINEEENKLYNILEFYEPLLYKKDEKKEEDISRVHTKEIILYEDLVYNYFDVVEAHEHYNEIAEFKKLLKYPSQRSIFLIQCYSWFSVTGIYYCISIFIKLIPGDVFINAILLYSIELSGYLFCVILLNYFNAKRKKTIYFFLFISILSTLLLIFHKNIPMLNTLYLILLLRFGISGAYNINFLYSTEVYPTTVRLTGFGINCNMGCFSAVILPLVLEIYIEEKIFLYFLIMLIGCFILQIFLPEINNILPNIIPEEVDEVYKDDKDESLGAIAKKARKSKLNRKESYFI